METRSGFVAVPRHLGVVKSTLLVLSLAVGPLASAQRAPLLPDTPPEEAPAGYPPPAVGSPPAPSAPARAPGAKTHDGFYLRLQLGPGYTSMSASVNGTGRSIAGGGSGFDLALGGALNRHTIVYATVMSSTAREPKSALSGR